MSIRKRIRTVAGHAAYPFWLRKDKSRWAGRVYRALERVATGNDERKRKLLEWSFRETRIGWGKRPDE